MSTPDVAVPFLDLDAGVRELRTEIDGAIASVLDGGRFVLGDALESFEREWAAYLGVRHCVGVGSGADAITIGLRALGVGPGDEVLVPAFTFVATWAAVRAAGAVPVGVDAELTTGGLDVDALAAAVTSRAAAILPVHLYGHPVDVDGVRAVAERHGLVVLEDACQAHGASIDGRRVGASTPAAWSFYPSKNLGGVGDGGAFTTDDDSVARAARALRHQGTTARDRHEAYGFSSRLDDLQAAVLSVRLRHLDAWNERRRRSVARYLDGLEDVGPSTFVPIRERAGACSAWHLFVGRTPDRAEVLARLERAGVEARVHYPVPPHRQPMEAERGLVFPVAEELAATVVSLPIGPHLPPDHVDVVVAALGDG